MLNLTTVLKIRVLIEEKNVYEIQAVWSSLNGTSHQGSLVLFKTGVPLPTQTKELLFYTPDPFEIRLEYADKQELPLGISPLISKNVINARDLKGFDLNHYLSGEGNEKQIKIKVQARIDQFGISTIDQVTINLPQLPIPVPLEFSTTFNLEPSPSNKNHQNDLNLTFQKMDSSIIKHKEAQNDLETVVFSIKEKLQLEEYASLIEENEKKELSELVQKESEWINGPEFLDADTETLTKRIASIQTLCKPILSRREEEIQREEVAGEIEDIYQEIQQRLEAQPETQPKSHLSSQSVSESPQTTSQSSQPVSQSSETTSQSSQPASQSQQTSHHQAPRQNSEQFQASAHQNSSVARRKLSEKELRLKEEAEQAHKLVNLLKQKQPNQFPSVSLTQLKDQKNDLQMMAQKVLEPTALPEKPDIHGSKEARRTNRQEAFKKKQEEQEKKKRSRKKTQRTFGISRF